MTGPPALPTSLDTTEKCLHAPCVPTYRIVTHSECGAKVLIPVRCKSRWCPRCAPIRSRELVERYMPVLESMTEPKFLTLTLRNVPRGDLDATRQRIMQCFQKLRRQKVFKCVRSGVWALDVTFRGDWHVHLHVIIDSPYVRQADISAAWEQITGGSPVVDIRKCRGVRKAARELLKYVSKFWEIDDYGAMDELKEAFRSKKQCDCWGAARKYRAPVVRQPVRCPRCGAPFSLHGWYVEEVDQEEAFRQKHGVLWADFYWTFEARAG